MHTRMWKVCHRAVSWDQWYTNNIQGYNNTTLPASGNSEVIADNIALLASGNSEVSIAKSLERAVHKVATCTCRWCIKANETKRVPINFTNKRITPNPIYKINYAIEQSIWPGHKNYVSRVITF